MLKDMMDEDTLKNLDSFRAFLETQQDVGEFDGLFNGGQHELSVLDDGSIDPDQLERIQERADRFASGLVETAARKKSTVLREMFSYLVVHVMRGDDTPQMADRVLRAAFMELGYIPAEKLNECLKWLAEMGDNLPLSEVVMLADHGFDTEEAVFVFTDAYFDELRNRLRAEAYRFLNALRRGPVRVKARSLVGDKYAQNHVKRFLNQACFDFGVTAKVIGEYSSEWMAAEVAKTADGIRAIGGLKALDRGLMVLAENLENSGICPQYTDRLERSILALCDKAGWNVGEVITRLDFLTEIHRAQPSERRARKQAGEAKAKEKSAVQKKYARNAFTGSKQDLLQGLAPMDRAGLMADRYGDHELVAVEQEAAPFEDDRASFVEPGVLAVEPKGSVWRYVYLIAPEMEQTDLEAGTEITDGGAGWVGGIPPLTYALSGLKQIKVCHMPN